jgi:hypothetical protein
MLKRVQSNRVFVIGVAASLAAALLLVAAALSHAMGSIHAYV